MSRPTLVPITCDCGAALRRDRNGRAVCTVDRRVVTMESLLARGLSPMWSRGSLVSHAPTLHAIHPADGLPLCATDEHAPATTDDLRAVTCEQCLDAL